MLFRLILLLILSGIVAYATLWLVANPGYVNIDWMGWQIETTMQVLLIFLLAFFLLIAIVSALYRFVFSLGKIRSHAQLAKRVKDQEQGLNVLIKALKAASDGEAHEGRRMTSEAAQLLQRSELTKLLAPFMPLPPTEMKGNRKLLEEVPARPAKGRLAAPETGSKLTKEPVAETPEVMALDVSKLTDLMRAKDWDGAEQLVNLAYPPQGKPPKAKSRLSDCLLLAKAMTAADMPIKDNLDHSLVLAKAAMRHESAVLVPASILAADLLVRQGHTDEAITILRDTWSKHPAYPLLARYVQLMCEETPEVQLANIEAVIQGSTESPEGDLVLGEAAINSKAWGRARRHLIAAVKAQPSAKAYSLLVLVEEEETKDEIAINRWRHKEENSSMDYGWHCRQCKAPSSAWAPLCPVCLAIGEIDWGLFAKPQIVPPLASPEVTLKAIEVNPLAEIPA